MKSLTLGKEGREKLRTQLRRLHDRDSHRMVNSKLINYIEFSHFIDWFLLESFIREIWI